MSSLTPTPKVAAGGAAGAAALVVWFILAQFGVALPDSLVSAITTLIMFGASWFTREKSDG